jgi:hypothetical protein
MIITIATKNNVTSVTIDGIARLVDLPDEYYGVSGIHYDSMTEIGTIQYVGHRKSDASFSSISICNTAIDLWAAAKPSKAAIWVLIKEKRTEINAGGLLVDGSWFHTESETLGQYAIMYGAISVNSLPDAYVFNSAWKTMDGDFRAMTVALLKQIVSIGIGHAAANYENAEQHKAAMESSAEPSTYDYSSGWTAIHI